MKTKHLLLVFLCFFLFNQCSTPSGVRNKKVLNFGYSYYIHRSVGDLLKDLDVPYRRLDAKYSEYGLFCGCDLVLETNPTIYVYIAIDTSIPSQNRSYRYRLWDTEYFKKERIAGICVRSSWFRKIIGDFPINRCRTLEPHFD